jgi:hypothetical protein
LDPDDHESEEAMPFRQAHIEAINYFTEEITSEHVNKHPSPRFVMSGNAVARRVRVTRDENSIMIEYEGTGRHEVVDRFEGGLLADRLKEFSETKVGSTDIELSRFRRLIVQGFEVGVSFCFLGTETARQRDWVVLSQGDAVAVASKIQRLCA